MDRGILFVVAANTFRKWRNSLVFSFKWYVKGDIFMHILAAAVEIKKAELVLLKNKPVRKMEMMIGWSFPPAGCHKINIDYPDSG